MAIITHDAGTWTVDAAALQTFLADSASTLIGVAVLVAAGITVWKLGRRLILGR